MFDFQDQEDRTKLEITERSVRILVREHRKFRLSSIFDVDYATAHDIVIKVGHFNLPLFNKDSKARLSGPRRWDDTRSQVAQRTFLVREQRRLR